MFSSSSSKMGKIGLIFISFFGQKRFSPKSMMMMMYSPNQGSLASVCCSKLKTRVLSSSVWDYFLANKNHNFSGSSRLGTLLTSYKYKGVL